MLISMEFFIYLLGCCVQHLNTSVVVEGIFLMKLGSYQYVDIIGDGKLLYIMQKGKERRSGISYMRLRKYLHVLPDKFGRRKRITLSACVCVHWYICISILKEMHGTLLYDFIYFFHAVRDGEGILEFIRLHNDSQHFQFCSLWSPSPFLFGVSCSL
ncbi:hypothetical protein QQP08_020441 [Theobroma cacao]|nr:hypothetical protein QQP08_020441 [Theobroma cacao]